MSSSAATPSASSMSMALFGKTYDWVLEADINTADLEPQRDESNRKSMMWKAAAVTSYIALTTLNILVLTTMFPTLTASFFLTLFATQLGISALATFLSDRSQAQANLRDLFDGATQKLQGFANHTHAQMADVLRGLNINPDLLPGRDFSTREFKISIAHYAHFLELCRDSETTLRHAASTSTTAASSATSTDILARIDRRLSDLSQNAFRKHYFTEHTLLPLKLRSAALLNKILLPASTASLQSLGTITNRGFYSRAICAMEEARSPYFVFNDGVDLSYTELRNMAVPQIQHRIFQRA